MTETRNYYVIDTSSLIELNLSYPQDIFSGLWEMIEQLIDRGFLISPKEVFKEISAQDDTLKEWAKKQEKLFVDLTPEQVRIATEIIAKYPSLAKAENEQFAADPFVLALAVAMQKDPQKTLVPTKKNRIIVTEEKLRGQRVRIPFVAQGYKIDCIPILEMCRQQGWKF